jgi:hypothetical protein
MGFSGFLVAGRVNGPTLAAFWTPLPTTAPLKNLCLLPPAHYAVLADCALDLNQGLARATFHNSLNF